MTQMGSSTRWRISLRISRAPLLWPKASLAICSSASGWQSKRMPFSSRAGFNSSIISRAMPWKSSWDRGRKTMTSSTRARNSGRRKSARAFSAFSRAIWTPDLVKPREPSRIWLPALEVMTMMVFSKDTTRPWASVILPSSRICSRMFSTSGWAFSISSSSTME